METVCAVWITIKLFPILFYEPFEKTAKCLGYKFHINSFFNSTTFKMGVMAYT